MTFTHGFQSTLPARGATSSTFADLLGSAHFNPRSPHGERRAGESRLRRADSISIHAPRTGSDVIYGYLGTIPVYISIHAPRTGSDGISPHCINRESIFQSTLPARGATWGIQRYGRSWKFQSTLPARGATIHPMQLDVHPHISIHAPRTGSDV